MAPEVRIRDKHLEESTSRNPWLRGSFESSQTWICLSGEQVKAPPYLIKKKKKVDLFGIMQEIIRKKP